MRAHLWCQYVNALIVNRIHLVLERRMDRQVPILSDMEFNNFHVIMFHYNMPLNDKEHKSVTITMHLHCLAVQW